MHCRNMCGGAISRRRFFLWYLMMIVTVVSVLVIYHRQSVILENRMFEVLDPRQNQSIWYYMLQSEKQKMFTDLVPNFNVSWRGNASSKTLMILFYNAHRSKWLSVKGIQAHMATCVYSNCRVTEDKAILPEAAAVVFHFAIPLLNSPSPPLNRSSRNAKQVWVFFGREPPTRFNLQPFLSPEWFGTFNWSMTYRRDSDVLSPYGTVLKRTTLAVKNYSSIFDAKTKMAVWIASNCNDQFSGRIHFVQQLRENGIQVDIFGNCGNESLSRGNESFIFREYTFFLSLENSFCKDYITEKVYGRYNEDIILVVRGGGDYKRYLPTDTYINALDFSDIKHLTQHMISLSRDKQRYITFLAEKDKYIALGPWPFGWIYGFCNLCTKLNNVKNQKVYTNIGDYLYSPSCWLP